MHELFFDYFKIITQVNGSNKKWSANSQAQISLLCKKSMRSEKNLKIAQIRTYYIYSIKLL